MKRIVMAAVLAATLVPAAVALACGKDCDCNHDKSASAAAPGVKVAAAEKEPFKLANVNEVAKLNTTSKLAFFDANTPDFRQKNGIIPGATLLTSASGYDVAKELPAAKDSKLVFYCANTKCMASHEAAKRAAGAGYTDVTVLSDGLLGWKGAGQPVAQVAPSKS